MNREFEGEDNPGSPRKMESEEQLPEITTSEQMDLEAWLRSQPEGSTFKVRLPGEKWDEEPVQPGPLPRADAPRAHLKAVTTCDDTDFETWLKSLPKGGTFKVRLPGEK